MNSGKITTMGFYMYVDCIVRYLSMYTEEQVKHIEIYEIQQLYF